MAPLGMSPVDCVERNRGGAGIAPPSLASLLFAPPSCCLLIEWGDRKPFGDGSPPPCDITGKGCAYENPGISRPPESSAGAETPPGDRDEPLVFLELGGRPAVHPPQYRPLGEVVPEPHPHARFPLPKRTGGGGPTRELRGQRQEGR